MTIGVTETTVVLCDFNERPMMAAQLASVRRRIGPTSYGDAPLLDRVEAQLREYFAGERDAFDLPIDTPGSAFQERVWAELRRIPYGETISYRELAGRVDAGGAYRAIGRANGSNRLAVIVPCHRVVAAGGGLDAKRILLDLEHNARPNGGRAPVRSSDRCTHGVIAAVDVDHLAGGHRRPVRHQEGAHLPNGGGIGQ
jgi:O-6-methylguanine DNA methyltransferase